MTQELADALAAIADAGNRIADEPMRDEIRAAIVDILSATAKAAEAGDKIERELECLGRRRLMRSVP